MKRIFKYALEVVLGKNQTIPLPVSYEIKKVAMQDGLIYLWAEHTGFANAMIDVQFQVYGTGHEIPEDHEYVGTTFDGPFVWHVYTRGKQYV